MSPLGPYFSLASVRAVIGLAALAAAAGAGAWLMGVVKDRDIAQIREGHALARAFASQHTRQRLEAAQARSDALTAELHHANTATLRLKEQLDDALVRATTGRPCLDGAALRLLDRAARPAAGRVPAPVGGPAAADAPDAAADPAHGGHATDTDVARWANRAYAQYAECAARLDALIRWHLPLTTPSTPSTPAE